MKICYIANAESYHTVKWATYFASLGHEIHVISHTDAKIPNINVHYINYHLKNFPLMVWKVHRLLRQIQPDVIHAHQANTCGLYAVSQNRIPVIVSAWGSDILVLPEQSKLLKAIVKYVIRKAYFMTSDAFYMTDKIVELGGSREKVYTFPMGVEASLTQYKHHYDLFDKQLKIISMRRLEDIYNIDIIIDGFHEALKENENLYLTVAAGGTHLHRLKEKVQKLGLERKVNFTGSYQPSDVGDILEKQDIFISVPNSDSTSVSLLESMCVGVFPILSDLPANREWVKNMRNGIILSNIDKNAVKEAILWCYMNKEHMKSVSEENRDIIKKRALWVNNAKVVEGLYEKLNQFHR